MLDVLTLASRLGLRTRDAANLLLLVEVLRDATAPDDVTSFAIAEAERTPNEITGWLVGDLARITRREPAPHAASAAASLLARVAASAGKASERAADAWADGATVGELLGSFEATSTRSAGGDGPMATGIALMLALDRAYELPSEADGRELPVIVRECHEGRFGVQARLLAFELQAALAHDEQARASARRGLLEWLGRGALVMPAAQRILACNLFRRGGEVLVDEVCRELVTAGWFWGRASDSRQASARPGRCDDDLRLDIEANFPAASVLTWQATLSDLITEHAALEAGDRLARLWVSRPPTNTLGTSPKRRAFVEAMVKIGSGDERPRTHTRAATTQTNTEIWCASPYVPITQGGSTARGGRGYPSVTDDAVLVRTSMAVCGAARILRTCGQSQRDAMVEFLFHASDVFNWLQTKGPRMNVYGSALVLFARDLMTRIGSGAEEAIDPLEIYDAAIWGARHNDRSIAAESMRWRSQVAEWLDEALPRAVDLEGPGRWFRPFGPNERPAAEEVLLDVADPAHDDAAPKRTSRDLAAGLLAGYFPTDFDRSRWDWRADCKPNRWRWLVIFDPEEAEWWAELQTHILRERRRAPAADGGLDRAAILAALGRLLSGDVEEGVPTLTAELARMTDPRRLHHLVRRRLIKTFQIDAHSVEIDDLLRELGLVLTDPAVALGREHAELLAASRERYPIEHLAHNPWRLTLLAGQISASGQRVESSESDAWWRAATARSERSLAAHLRRETYDIVRSYHAALGPRAAEVVRRPRPLVVGESVSLEHIDGVALPRTHGLQIGAIDAEHDALRSIAIQGRAAARTAVPPSGRVLASVVDRHPERNLYRLNCEDGPVVDWVDEHRYEIGAVGWAHLVRGTRAQGITCTGFVEINETSGVIGSIARGTLRVARTKTGARKVTLLIAGERPTDLLVADAAHLAGQWFADVIAVHEAGDSERAVTVARTPQGWVPVAEGPLELVAEIAAMGPMTLAYGGVAPPRAGVHTWRFSHGLTQHYCVSEDDLTSASAERIMAEAETHDIGIRLRFVLEERDDDVRLAVTDEAADDTNIRWLSVLEHGRVILATRHEHALVHTPGGGLPQIIVQASRIRTDTVEIEVDEWDWAEALRGVVNGVEVRRKQLPGITEPSRARYERLVDMRVDAAIDVKRVMWPPTGGTVESLRAYTPDDVVVHVRSESMSLLPLNAKAADVPEALRFGRRGVVERVLAWKRLGQVPMDKTSHSALLGALVADAARDDVVGVIVERPSRRAAGSEVVAWCLEGDAIVPVSMPASELNELPMLGDILVPAVSGTAVEVKRPERHVRLQFEFVEDLDGARLVGDGIGPAGERGQIWQDPSSPRLVIRPQGSTSVEGGGDGMGATSLWISSRSYANLHGGSWQRATVTVATGQTLSGDVRPARKLRSPAVSRTRLSLQQTEPERVTVQREFLLGVASPTEKPQDKRIDERERLQRRWAEYVRQPREVQVTVRGSTVQLHGLQAPDRVGGWTRIVPIAEGEGTWIEDHSYPDSPALAWVSPATEGASVSLRGVPAMDIERFARERQLRDGTWDELRPRITFVQLEYPTPDAPVALFEWGHGLTLRVPVSRLYLEGAAISPTSFRLFHGDHVQRARLVEPAGPDGAGERQRILDLGAFDWSRARRLYEQAGEPAVVHAIDIVIAPGGAGVRVIGARAPELNSEGIDREVPLRRAFVSEESRAVLCERASGRTEEHRCVVYARVDRDRFKASEGRDLVFDLVRLVAEENAEARLGQLKDGDRLLVMGGRATESSGGNDVRLELLPLGDVDLDVVGATAPRWYLLRRWYSVRESALRLAFEGWGETCLEKQPFLAHVRSVRDGRLSLLEVPSRHANVLRAMLSVRGAGHAAVASSDARHTVIEWEPGVHIQLDSDEVDGAVPGKGAIVHVAMAGELIAMNTVVQSDGDFIGREGRTCMLLGKNFLRSEVRAVGAFTVAGLPGVEVSVRDPRHEVAARLAGLLASPRGAVAHVRRGAAGFELGDAPGPYGWVAVSEAATAELVDAGESGGELVEPIEWSALSYADGPRERIVRRLHGKGPALHDRMMVRWAGLEDGVPQGRLVPSPMGGALRGRSGAAFERRLDGRLTLRYDRDLAALALPPGALVEGPVATDVATETLVIADVRGDALSVGASVVYTELSPGWVYKLSPAFFGVGVGEAAVETLTAFDWPSYGPGDEVCVRRRILRPGEIGFLEPESFAPSPRGRLGARSVLPVVSVADGDWVLGANPVILRHPGASTAAAGDIAIVHKTNELRPVSAQDVAAECPLGALLVEVDGHARVAGLEGRAAIYRSSARGGSSWLRRELDRDRGVELIRALGGAVEVLVTAVRSDAIVYCNAGVDDDLPIGSVAWAVAIAWYRGMLVLRAGRRLLRIDLEDLVRDIVPAAKHAVADWLIETRVPMWIRNTADGYRSGFVADDGEAGDVTILRAILPFAAAWDDDHSYSGAVCRVARSGAFAWIRLASLGWARLDARELSVIEGETARSDAQPNEALSLVGGPITSSLFSTLEVGTPVRAHVVSAVVPERGTALARLLPSNVLVEVQSMGIPDIGATFLATVAARRSGRRVLILRARGITAGHAVHGISTDLTAMPWTPPLSSGAFDKAHWWRADAREAALVACTRSIDGRRAIDGLLALCELDREQPPAATPLAVRMAWAIGVRAALSLHLEALENTVPALLAHVDGDDVADARCAELLRRIAHMQVPAATQALETLARSLRVREDIGLEPSLDARVTIAAGRTLFGYPEDLQIVLGYATEALILPRLVAVARALAPSHGRFPVTTLNRSIVAHLERTRRLASGSSASLTLLPLGFQLPDGYCQATSKLVLAVESQG